MERLGRVCVALAALAGTTSAHAQPSITPFFEYGVHVLSGDGTVGAGSHPYHGLHRWRAATGLEVLGTLFAAEMLPLDASWDGDAIVGAAGLPGQTFHRAFVWREGSGLSEIYALPGFNGMQADGVSADGDIVVGTMGGFGSGRAFRWTKRDGVQSLGILPGGWRSSATGVSTSGKVIVGMSSTPTSNRAFRWTEETGMVDLGLFPGGTSSYAKAVSADGDVVVGHNNTPNPGSSRAFRWTEATGMVDLGVLPGHQESVAGAASGDGSIVIGYSWDGFHSSTATAFCWTPQAGMRPFSEFLLEAGLDLTGWTLQAVNDVSDDGLTFTGGGTLYGAPVAFVVTIPAPASVFAAVPALVVACRRRRLLPQRTPPPARAVSCGVPGGPT